VILCSKRGDMVHKEGEKGGGEKEFIRDGK
jgi:hypothetical protein